MHKWSIGRIQIPSNPFQSCGMTAAAFTIFWMKIKLEWHSVVFCSFGAIFGMVLGLEVKSQFTGS